MNPPTMWIHFNYGASAPHGKELVQSCTNGKPAQYFPIPVNTKFFSICHRLAIVSMLNYGLNSTPWSSLGVGAHSKGVENQGGRNQYQPKGQPHIPIRIQYPRQAYLAPFSSTIIHNAAGRLTDSNSQQTQQSQQADNATVSSAKTCRVVQSGLDFDVQNIASRQSHPKQILIKWVV